MANVVILIGFYPDPRYENRFLELKKKHTVTLIFWNKSPEEKSAYSHAGIRVRQIDLKANPKDPIKRLRQYPAFRRACMKILKEEKPDLVDVQALDMLDIVCAYKRRYHKQTKIIYEVPDLHRYIIDQPKKLSRAILRQILILKDRKASKSVDLLVTTSQKYYDIYFQDFMDKSKVMVIPNMPRLEILKDYTPKSHEGKLTIGYVGVIRYIRQIEILLEAAQEAGWNVLLAGNEFGTKIRDACIGRPGVTYMGPFDFEKQIVDIYQKCDAVYSVYDADMANVRAALPNKLYESVYCELPIIVAKNTYLAEMVKAWNVGTAVDHRSADELATCLMQLKSDHVQYETYIRNCQKRKPQISIAPYMNELARKIDELLTQ